LSNSKDLTVVRSARKVYKGPKPNSKRTILALAYDESRHIARIASPKMMRELIKIVEDQEEDNRVRSVCAIAVLDRAGLRPIDYDPNEGKDQREPFEPRDYTPEELAVLEAAFKLMVAREKEKKEAAAAVAGLGAVLEGEIIPPEESD